MDRPKAILTVLKKHHFWVLCGVVIAVSPGFWWIATAAVDKDRQARADKIEVKLQKMAEIKSRPQHPNQQVIDAIKTRTVELKQEVLESWKRLYQEQKRNNPLPEILSPEFKLMFESLERQPDAQVEIDWKYRQEYMDFIGRHVRTLPEMVDCVRPAPVAEEAANPDGAGPAPPGAKGAGTNLGVAVGEGGRRAYDGPTGAVAAASTSGFGADSQYGMKMIGVVEWDPADQARLVQRFNWQTWPTTQQVRLAQEDLWVYEALLRIIKNTNGRVKNRNDAAIKQIQALQIGRDASLAWQKFGSVGYPSGPVGGGGPGGPTSYDGYTRSTTSAGSTPPAGEFHDPQYTSARPSGPSSRYGPPSGYGPYGQSAAPTDGRYVDEEGQPLGAGQEHPYAEFKLMPIRMVLLMNQTKLSKLLVECANSNMPVEVRSVSVGVDSGTMVNLGMPTLMGAGSGSLSHGYGAGYDSGRPSGHDGSYSGYGPGSYPPTGAAGGATGLVQRRTLDVPVEIQGTICIFNPPNESKLGTGAAAKAPAEVPPATPPAPAEPPPPTPAPTAEGPVNTPTPGAQPATTGQ
jgi:hypothetical protein